MRALFWISIAVLFYVYAGYPALVLLIGRLRPAAVQREQLLPAVSIVIAAYNEARVIGPTLRNLVNVEYPPDRLEVIVVSDGSTDGTDTIVQEFAGSGVQLHRQEPRGGKAAALNVAARRATGDVIVFADANSLYERTAVRNLARNFADARVGYVTGKLTYLTADGSMVGDGCTLYMKYENLLRRAESNVGSIVGVNGGIDAIRRSLWVDMRPEELPDLVLPFKVVERGLRVVYDPDAVVREYALADPGDEYRMRVRVALRALWTIAEYPHLLRIDRFGLFAWQLLSHKVLRYLAFWFLLLSFVSSLFLARASWIYTAAAGLQVALILAAGTGWVLGRTSNWRPRLLFAPYYFLLVNVAAAQATVKFFRGERHRVWQPRLG